MKIHIPAFVPMARCNEHPAHGPIDVDLGEDVVKVTRCRDCEYFNDLAKTSLLVNGKHVKAGWCDRCARWDEEYRMLPDDFCSYGCWRNDKT